MRTLPTGLQRLLDGSGRDWRLEFGGKHRKLYIDDKLVMVVPHTLKDCSRRFANAESCVRRWLRQHPD